MALGAGYFCYVSPCEQQCLAFSVSSIFCFLVMLYIGYLERKYAWFKKTDGDLPPVRVVDIDDPEEAWFSAFEGPVLTARPSLPQEDLLAPPSP